MSIEIFMSYAHADRLWIDKFEKHLAVLKRQGVISTWHERDLNAGTEWAREVDVHLERSQIVLLFVSADFMASKYVYDTELKQILEKQKNNKIHVVPIILRPVYWHGSPLSNLQPLPSSGKPISAWKNTDEAFADVTKALYSLIKMSGYEEKLVSQPISSIEETTYITLDQSNIEIQLDKAKMKMQEWKDNLIRENEWNWYTLGEALQIAYKIAQTNPDYQPAWTALADIYHRIGNRDLAERCLDKSELLINTVSDVSIRSHKEVQINIDTGYPFNKDGGLHRQLPPKWFENRFEIYLTLP